MGVGAGLIVVACLAELLVGRTPRSTPPPPPPPAPVAAPVCAEPAPPADTRVRTLILDWKTDAERAAARATYAQLVADEAKSLEGLEILSAADLRAALALEADKQMLGCDDSSSCVAEIAEALDATLVVQGELARAADGATLVNLSLLNARAVVVVNRVALAWGGSDDALPDVVRAATQLLLFDKSKRPPGSIEVQGLPKETRVFLDDVDVSARATSGTLEGVAVGTHVLRAVTAGKLPTTVPVVVRAGARAVVIPVFEDEPVGVGLLLAGGAAAIVVGVGATLGLMWATDTDRVEVKGKVEPYTFRAASTGSASSTGTVATGSVSSP